MKKVFRIAVVILLVVALGSTGAVAYWLSRLPDVGPAASVGIERTPERIERGRYLANHVAACMDCHSKRDWTKFSGPAIPGTEGGGGERFDAAMGLPGTFYASNITPAALESWTDGEILRAFTAGLSRDGRPLFPLMPYHAYGRMDEEDAHAIVAYLRTLPSVQNTVPISQPAFPMTLLIRTLPRAASFGKRPDAGNRVAYGGYLAQVAACVDCHTPARRGSIIESRSYEGGREFPMADGTKLVSSNLTPHPEKGIGIWTEAFFLARFEAAAAAVKSGIPVKKNTIMPWGMYSGMAKEDLAAIFAYLQTLKALP